jgi:hypothetical protein
VADKLHAAIPGEACVFQDPIFHVSIGWIPLKSDATVEFGDILLELNKKFGNKLRKQVICLRYLELSIGNLTHMIDFAER